MAWILTEKEIEETLCADAAKRYEHFVLRVCETGKIWSLYKEGWATLVDGDKTLMPFWPHQTYAERFRTGDWLSYQAEAIDLSAFLERWIPGMQREGLEPAVFPVAGGTLATTCLDDLATNLRAALAGASS
jgi:hypothetical protein